jgi:cytochrome c oxidase cbb3-type subunit 1
MSLSLSRSLSLSSAAGVLAAPEETSAASARVVTADRGVMAITAWHSLLWLVIANVIGVMIAAMLLAPRINLLLGDWTYGRWMPVHINLQLYGWCSLPLLAFLFKVYGADREPIATWCAPVLWVWSTALAIGAFSWLQGHSSGKLFLDWTGYPRILFPLALLCVWALLTASLRNEWKLGLRSGVTSRMLKAAGLVLLLVVPFLIYFASSPAIYPPINPDTGGPTGASQLESTLVIIAILLLLPHGLAARKRERSISLPTAWIVFTAEALLCLGLGRADVSHHRPTQWVSLGSLLVWIPLIPLYYEAFDWHDNTRRWRIAFLCWWAVLVPTGWMLFLPGVLDHFKFTDGLVGHSLLAMAGFVSSLLIFVLVQLLGEDGWIFNGTWSFYVWQASVAVYVLIMFYAGWQEGFHPAFSMLPGALRNSIYALRLLVGVLMLLASLDWFIDAFALLRELRAPAIGHTQVTR